MAADVGGGLLTHEYPLRRKGVTCRPPDRSVELTAGWGVRRLREDYLRTNTHDTDGLVALYAEELPISYRRPARDDRPVRRRRGHARIG